jgi:hypothetical protein
LVLPAQVEPSSWPFFTPFGWCLYFTFVEKTAQTKI